MAGCVYSFELETREEGLEGKRKKNKMRPKKDPSSP